MKVTHVSFDEYDNLLVEGISEKGREEKTYIAVPPPKPGTAVIRIDIISHKNLYAGYNFGNEDEVIIIKV